MSHKLKLISQIYLIIFLFLLFYFAYQGLTTQVWEGDSLAYHIPIAKKLLNLKLNNFDNFLFYYPASSHIILSLFILLNINLQLYNVLALGLLFLSSLYLAKNFKLNKNLSLIYATVICTLTPVIRLVLTQTIDIWLAIWFSLSLALLIKPQKDYLYIIKLGLVMGMLLGTKYTGGLFLIALLLIFISPLLRLWRRRGKSGFSQIGRGVLLILIIFLTGGLWYLRNFLETRDFFYPASEASFALNHTRNIQNILLNFNNFKIFINNLFSEYLIWGLLLILMPLAAFRLKLKNNNLKLIILGLLNFLIYLIIPVSFINNLSDMRYGLPVFISLILALFLLAEKYKKDLEISLIALISVLPSLTLINHKPKLFLIFNILLIIYLFKNLKLIKN